MGRIMDGLKAAGAVTLGVASAIAEAKQREDELVNELLRRGDRMDPAEVRKVASVLLRDAEPIVWK